MVDTTVAAIHDEQLWQDAMGIEGKWQDRVVDHIIANKRDALKRATRVCDGAKHTGKAHENRLGHSKKAGSPRNPFYREHNVEYAATQDYQKLDEYSNTSFPELMFLTCLLDLGSPPLRDDNGPASIEARVEWCERLYDWYEATGNPFPFVSFSKAYDRWWFNKQKLHNV
jgi:hypothetical protein